MDFRDLTYVLAIAKYQNITRAAEALYVGQPTLSKFLITLEDNLGLKLFRRIRHRYVLTYAGERYVEQASKILQMKSDLDAELADIIKRDVGVLNVSFAPMRCTYMLPCTLPAFSKIHPNVKVNIFEGSSDENDRRLLDGQIDLAFYSRPGSENSQLEYETLWKEEMFLCTCRGHPLAAQARPNPASRFPRLDPSLITDELVMLMMPDQRTRQIMDLYCREHGLQFRNTMYTSNMPAIMELVSMGYGISFLFESHLKHRPVQSPIDFYSFGDPVMVSDFVAAYRKGGYLSQYSRDFIEIARQADVSGTPLTAGGNPPSRPG